MVRHWVHTQMSVAIIHDNDAQFICAYLLVQLLFDIANTKSGTVNMCVSDESVRLPQIGFANIRATPRGCRLPTRLFQFSIFSTGKRKLNEEVWFCCLIRPDLHRFEMHHFTSAVQARSNSSFGIRAIIKSPLATLLLFITIARNLNSKIQVQMDKNNCSLSLWSCHCRFLVCGTDFGGRKWMVDHLRWSTILFHFNE